MMTTTTTTTTISPATTAPLPKYIGYTGYTRPKPLVKVHTERRDIDIRDLFAMHGVNRSPGGALMKKWRKRWLENLPEAFYDQHDNLIVQVGMDKSSTIFTSHTDTVGRDSYSNIYASNGILRNHNGVLGADDTVGCWIMRRMIKAGVPGLYIFHDGEEIGCVGSRRFVEDNTEYLKGINRVVSFDRMGYSDIITNQSGTDCCSNEFATALAAQLNSLNLDFRYKPSALGAFTDSAQYMYDVPECTNISVGYFGQHGSGECLDMYHAYDLMEACIKVDWESLPVVRNPDEAYNWRKYKNSKYPRSTSARYNEWDDLDEAYYDARYELFTTPHETLATPSSGSVKKYSYDDIKTFDDKVYRCKTAAEFVQLFYMDEDLAAAWINWHSNMRWSDVEVVYDKQTKSRTRK